MRLGQGTILRRACAIVGELLSKLDCDPFFRDDVEDGSSSASTAEVVLALLSTLLHIVICFRRFLRYQSKVQALCRAFNPTTYQEACEEFLSARPEDLDAGYTLPLFQDAWRNGPSEADMMRFLTSDDVQQELEDFLWASDATTLDVERKQFADKKSERGWLGAISVCVCVCVCVCV